ncbi:MAG: glutathione S-transferase N-terminal domain-containing protein [Gammaproteobacteria bacterium]|nr:glutathione S-transferase N-terminal domain-containing protein [Gammaproteobacteria bacterium]MDH3578112.1 glutathione S-transferase N-terminal domain-containing protein [Gammaproteobacteria bacterium]
MRLFYSPFHDFVHKVLVVAFEAGILRDIEMVPTFPFRNLDGKWVQGQYDVSPLNPLGKVPFLALDDGSTLYSSQVVVEYLDSLSARPLFPERGRIRFDALRRLALGDAIFEFAVQMSMEGWRDPKNRRRDLYEWLWPKIERALDQLEHETATWTGFDIGHVGTLQGVSYLDAWASDRADIIGNPCEHWRQRWPALADWFGESLLRPSVQSHYRVPYAGDTSPEQHAAAIKAVLRDRDNSND